MGLFDKKECCICGGKAGMLTRQKLVDKSFICGDCVDKCSPNLHGDNYEKMTKEDVLASMDYTKSNNELFETQFQETEVIKSGILGGKRVISVDRRNGWWVVAGQTKPDVFSFEQIASWQLKLDTTRKSEDEMRERTRPVMPPRQDMPMCRPDEKISKMYVRVALRHPFITYVDLDVMSAIFVTDGDIQAGYQAAMEIFQLFESYMYQPNYGYAQQPAYAPQQNTYTAPAADPTEELKKYKELLDMGAITRQEFETKKRQLLGF